MWTLEDENGAVEVDEATSVPVKVFLAGPIKYWWGTKPDGTKIWGTPEHVAYTKWRDVVRTTIVATGFCVTYSPHRAIQGSWHPDLQKINNVAIEYSDVMVELTPPGISAHGTAEEMELAKQHNIPIIHMPPGKMWNLIWLTEVLTKIHNHDFDPEEDI